MNSWSAKKALAVCDTQWGRWSDSLHGKEKVIQS